MSGSFRKKLIEVALPLDAINAASVAEKKIHVGSPANLHAWWARRPLSACRAVILASILDDPGEHLRGSAADAERRRLFALIRRLVKWEANRDPEVLAEVRNLVGQYLVDDLPTVVDPFCGSGSILIEAQRLGLSALGFDLNPVAVAISKALVEVPSTVSGHAPINPVANRDLVNSEGTFRGFESDLQFYCKALLDRAHELVAKLYAGPQRQGTTIAWIWSRTSPCPNPACGATIPLIKSFWLSKGPRQRAWLVPRGFDGARANFEIEEDGVGEPLPGTVAGRGARCLNCNTTTPFSELRAAAKRGLAGYQLIAVVTKLGTQMLFHRPTVTEEKEALAISPDWEPNTSLPKEALGFRVQKYGLTKHRDLFLPRQMKMLNLFADALEATIEQIRLHADGDEPYANSLATYLAIYFDRLVQTNNTLVRWFTHKERPSKPQATFDKQTVQMVWDFAEGNPLANSTGGWTTCCKYPQTALQCLPTRPGRGRIEQGDATQLKVPDGPIMFCTDPPYFDNIGYADLSDFFYIWLRRVLRKIYPQAFQTILVPKAQELVADPARHAGSKDDAASFFSDGMRCVFQRMREQTSAGYPMTLFYAFKQSETDDEGTASTGWEEMLQAIVDTGWMITGTWPIRTEYESRPRAIGANALASSIVLVCRKRPEDASITTRAEFLKALKHGLPPALRLLQQGSIAPVDLAQASIGPGMAVFTRYSTVLESDDSSMTIKTALQLINQALDEYLSEQEAEYDADTRFAITWFETHGMETGLYGTAETLATARGVAVAGVEESGILLARGGKVRLLCRDEMPEDWDPATDKRLTAWECAQYLIRKLEAEGEGAAADLLARLGARGEVARDLAYRLYGICERKKWADEARAYNGLVVAWPELTRLAAQAGAAGPAQAELGV